MLVRLNRQKAHRSESRAFIITEHFSDLVPVERDPAVRRPVPVAHAATSITTRSARCAARGPLAALRFPPRARRECSRRAATQAWRRRRRRRRPHLGRHGPRNSRPTPRARPRSSRAPRRRAAARARCCAAAWSRASAAGGDTPASARESDDDAAGKKVEKMTVTRDAARGGASTAQRRQPRRAHRLEQRGDERRRRAVGQNHARRRQAAQAGAPSRGGRRRRARRGDAHARAAERGKSNQAPRRADRANELLRLPELTLLAFLLRRTLAEHLTQQECAYTLTRALRAAAAGSAGRALLAAPPVSRLSRSAERDARAHELGRELGVRLHAQVVAVLALSDKDACRSGEDEPSSSPVGGSRVTCSPSDSSRRSVGGSASGRRRAARGPCARNLLDAEQKRPAGWRRPRRPAPRREPARRGSSRARARPPAARRANCTGGAGGSKRVRAALIATLRSPRAKPSSASASSAASA